MLIVWVNHVMEDNPLISYVVTTYNIEKFVQESVECAFAQTYTPLEIVLSDDCSSDRTFEIMQKMARGYKGQHKIVLNRNSSNLGITRHMNKAYMELAAGRIIVAAHGDDISLPERTQKSYEYLVTHPDITAVSFSIDIIDESGNALPSPDVMVDKIHIYDFNSLGSIPAPSRCFYKKVMDEFGPLKENCPTEDEIISFRSLIQGKNALLPDKMVKYRKHCGSSSNPENFSKFPLDLILSQQDADMMLAVNNGWITDMQRSNTYAVLKSNMLKRRAYRVYFTSRKIKDLTKLIAFPEISLRTRLHYIKEHFKYIKVKYEKKA